MSDRRGEAVGRLDDLARRLRRDCPWDREQDERSIVPHTVEEAYELADAAASGDDGKLLDELGDVLYQVVFLALLMEERGAGDLTDVADHCVEKLVSRHPHVFGDAEARTAAEVLERWEHLKRREPGRGGAVFHDVPENLPSLMHARKVQRRAATTGFDWPDHAGPLEKLREELDELSEVVEAEVPDTSGGRPRADHGSEALYEELGDVLFAAVNVARKLHVDPELALRASTARFRARVAGAGTLAEADGATWSELTLADQERYYRKSKARTNPGR